MHRERTKSSSPPLPPHKNILEMPTNKCYNLNWINCLVLTETEQRIIIISFIVTRVMLNGWNWFIHIAEIIEFLYELTIVLSTQNSRQTFFYICPCFGVLNFKPDHAVNYNRHRSCNNTRMLQLVNSAKRWQQGLGVVRKQCLLRYCEGCWVRIRRCLYFTARRHSESKIVNYYGLQSSRLFCIPEKKIQDFRRRRRPANINFRFRARCKLVVCACVSLFWSQAWQ